MPRTNSPLFDHDPLELDLHEGLDPVTELEMELSRISAKNHRSDLTPAADHTLYSFTVDGLSIALPDIELGNMSTEPNRLRVVTIGGDVEDFSIRALAKALNTQPDHVVELAGQQPLPDPLVAALFSMGRPSSVLDSDPVGEVALMGPDVPDLDLY